MTILLVRHGRPVCDERTPIQGSDFAAWVRAYDSAALDGTVTPPQALLARAATVGCIVTSTMRRGGESAHLLVPNRPLLSEPVFDEVALSRSVDLRLTLKPASWDRLTRLAWFCGWSRDGESLTAARERSRRAVERLTALTHTHGSVLLVGHGLMNALIRHELRRRSWSTTSLRTSYWSVMEARQKPLSSTR